MIHEGSLIHEEYILGCGNFTKNTFLVKNNHEECILARKFHEEYVLGEKIHEEHVLGEPLHEKWAKSILRERFFEPVGAAWFVHEITNRRTSQSIGLKLPRRHPARPSL